MSVRPVELALVAALSLLLYVSLYAELPLDDTLGYSAEIEAGRYEWDAAHLLMQPATVVWHRLMPGRQPALVSQRQVNTLSAMAGLVVFHCLLAQLGAALPLRAFATASVATSFNVLALASSGHMKLLAFPWLTLALALAATWLSPDGTPRPGRLIASALCLAAATLFLASSAVTAPLAALAVWCTAPGDRGRWRPALAYLGIAGGLAVGGFAVGYLAVTPAPHGARGLFDFVLAKGHGRYNPLLTELPVRLARAAYALPLNLLYTGEFGTVCRARLTGLIGSFAGYERDLLQGAAPVALGLIIVVLASVSSVAALRRRQAPGTVAFAFLLGAVLFGAYWNLSEAEFYFPATAPLVLLVALSPCPKRAQAWLNTLLVAALICNVALWAWPRRQYPFHDYGREFQAEIQGPNLAVCFLAYSGKPSLGLYSFQLPAENLWPLDSRLRELGRKEDLLTLTRQRVDAALAQGGRVWIIGVLDQRDWNAPWPILRRFQLTKAELTTFFHGHWRVARTADRAELPCWELTPRPVAPAPPPAVADPAA